MPSTMAHGSCRIGDVDVRLLVLAGPEIGARVMEVGAGEQPPVAAFAEHRVPQPADLRRVDAAAAVGAAAVSAG